MNFLGEKALFLSSRKKIDTALVEIKDWLSQVSDGNLIFKMLQAVKNDDLCAFFAEK